MKFFDNLMADIKKSIRAVEIVEDIWTELGPYNDVLSDELNNKIRKFFEFDDSE